MNPTSATASDNSDKLTQTTVRVLFALSLFLVVIRFINLNSDSPLFYSGYSTSEISDPYMYTSFARNKILFDEWDPYHYARWTSWKVSIVSGFSFLVFLIAGVSRVSANIVGLVLQLGGFLFFMLALARYRPRAEVAFGAFLLLSTSGLFFTGRIPLLENGVIFLSGLTVWTYLRFRDNIMGVVVVGALALTIALAAKLNGVALLAPLLIDTLFLNSNSKSRSESYKLAGAMASGFVVFGVLYSLLIYGMSPAALFEYFSNQTAAVGLTPRISGGFLETLASILLYGSRNGLFRFQPIFMILTGAGLLLVTLRATSGRLLLAKPSDRLLVFVSVWFLIGLTMLLPYSYRPSRYFMPLMLPGAALSAYALAAALRGAFARDFKIIRPSLKSWGLLLFCAFVVVYLSVGVESAVRQFIISGKRVMTQLNPTGVGIGLVLSALFIMATLRGIRIKKTISVIFAFIALGALTLVQAKYLYAGLTEPRDPLHLQVQDVGSLLGPEAVIAGTYGPAFTIDNHLRNLIHPFSAKLYEGEFFKRFPVTHIAVAPSEMKIVRQRYPAMNKAHQVATVWTRDGSYLIYRVPEIDYAETDYERGMDFIALVSLDSALFYFDRFLEKHPSSFRARIVKAKILANQAKVKPAVALLKELSREYWEYYFVHLLAGREYVTLYRITRRPEFKTLALAEYARSYELNPHVSPPKRDLP